MNLYLDNFGSAGFHTTDLADLQVGDVLLMQVASPVPNHAAVYLGDGLILHHLQGRLSSRDVYGGYWHKVTTHALRHPHLHTHQHVQAHCSDNESRDGHDSSSW
jgi:cell wall-associated NlpC family hydrolase